MGDIGVTNKEIALKVLGDLRELERILIGSTTPRFLASPSTTLETGKDVVVRLELTYRCTDKRVLELFSTYHHIKEE